MEDPVICISAWKLLGIFTLAAISEVWTIVNYLRWLKVFLGFGKPGDE